MSNVAIKGTADGPDVFVPQLGCKVPTFTSKSEGRFKSLAHHVPPSMRGAYRPNELANFEPEKSYRTDHLGYMLCDSKTVNNVDCLRKATNRSMECEIHGGSLHSEDKFIKTDQSDVGPTQALSRYKQFLAGIITIDDLDDEELASCGFRAKNGNIYKPKNVPRDLANGFTKAIYERAKVQLLALTVDAVDTVGEIMKNNSNEPDIRLKAALSVIERNLGKPTQTIALTADKPFEEVFSDVFTGTREESRQQRKAIESERVYAEEVPIDTERSDIDETSPQPIDGLDNMPGEHESTKPVVNQEDSDLDGHDQQDSGMFSRNHAILAQTVQFKPFKYDLSDKRDKIVKATKKRYASRALGIDLNAPNQPFIREETQLEDGTWFVKYLAQQVISTQVASKAKIKKRKAYTLSDF